MKDKYLHSLCSIFLEILSSSIFLPMLVNKVLPNTINDNTGQTMIIVDDIAPLKILGRALCVYSFFLSEWWK